MKTGQQTYATPYGAIRYWVYPASNDAPWLIFLPGLTADHHLFDRQLMYFRGKYNCLAWDPPAHGDSRPFALRFSMKDMAAYLHDILQEQSIVHPILIGQSMGGYLAQYVMDEYPGSAAGFISIDSCSLKRKYYTAWELAWLKHTEKMYLRIPWRVLIQCGSNGTAKTAYGRRLMKRTMETYTKPEYCALAAHGFRILAETVEEQREYTPDCPVLLLCGEHDMAGSAKRYNRQWTKQDGYRLIWIPNAGHNANTDAPEWVNACIEAFVRSLK